MCEKGLLEECGKLDVPGRPTLFRTTGDFLRSFGLSSLTELPEIEGLEDERMEQLTLPMMEEEAKTDTEGAEAANE